MIALRIEPASRACTCLPELITGHVQKGQVAIRTHAEYLLRLYSLELFVLNVKELARGGNYFA